MSEATTRDPESVRTYEISYLMSPALAEDKVGAVLLPVKDLLASRNVSVIAEEAPKFRRLAYSIRVKHSGVASQVFDSAFFGWLRFDADSDTALAVKKLLESSAEVFRFLLLKPSPAASYAPTPVRMFTRRAAQEPVAFEKRAADAEAPKPAVSDEELDRRIEELVGA